MTRTKLGRFEPFTLNKGFWYIRYLCKFYLNSIYSLLTILYRLLSLSLLLFLCKTKQSVGHQTVHFVAENAYVAVSHSSYDA